jgi:lysophospholipase L1-like esterase
MSDLRWAAVTVVLLLVAVATEYVARWWLRYRSAYYVFSPGRRLLLHPHPKVFPELEPSIRFSVNGEGERGDEVPSLRAGETLYRILVVGGSQPEGYLLDQHTCWPGALHRLLETPLNLQKLEASKVHVGSIARSGVGSEALDHILERVLVRYPRLQALIVLVGASDVLRWLEQGAPPSPPTSPSTSEIFMCHPELTFGGKPRSLALTELILRARQRWLRPVEVHERAGGWVGAARAMRAQAKVIRTAMPDPDAMLSNFDHYFRQVLHRAKAHADRVLVVRQPWFDKHCTAEEAAHMWHGGMGQVWREQVNTYYSLEVVSSLMALLNDRVALVADELDVEQLDLMPLLEPSLVTYYDGFHATPAGARTVAAAVAAAVLRQPLPSGRFLDRRSGIPAAGGYAAGQTAP